MEQGASEIRPLNHRNTALPKNRTPQPPASAAPGALRPRTATGCLCQGQSLGTSFPAQRETPVAVAGHKVLHATLRLLFPLSPQVSSLSPLFVPSHLPTFPHSHFLPRPPAAPPLLPSVKPSVPPRPRERPLGFSSYISNHRNYRASRLFVNI